MSKPIFHYIKIFLGFLINFKLILNQKLLSQNSFIKKINIIYNCVLTKGLLKSFLSNLIFLNILNYINKEIVSRLLFLCMVIYIRSKYIYRISLTCLDFFHTYELNNNTFKYWDVYKDMLNTKMSEDIMACEALLCYKQNLSLR